MDKELRIFSHTKGFLITLAFSFAFSIIVSMTLMTPYIENSFEDIQNETHQSEAKLTAQFIQVYLHDRIEILNDIARYPIVKNGVMGVGISREDLSDFLREITILGKQEDMALVNIAGEIEYRRGQSIPSVIASDAAWFNRLMEGSTKFEVNLLKYNERDLVQLAVPVLLNGYVEGILLSNIQIKLNAIVEQFSTLDKRTLSLTKDTVTLSAKHQLASDRITTLYHKIESSGILLTYHSDTQLLDQQRDAFIWSVTVSIVMTLGLTLIIALVTGNAFIVAPFKKLLELTRERDTAVKEAEKSAQAKGEFLANMSHEIRTPLNGVHGMLSLLERSPLTEQQTHYLNLAKNSADSLLTLINDILDFSKIEAGKLDLEKLTFDLHELFESTLQSMSFRAKENNVSLHLDLTKISVQYVEGDPGRLRQVLNNLLSNAVKFSKNGNVLVEASFQLKTGSEMGVLDFSVTDTGIGIPAEKLTNLFDSFTQVDSSTTRKYGGTGLGLAIVKQLCHLMGGEISATSQVGHGSVFSASLPLLAKNQSAKKIVYDLQDQNIMLISFNEQNTTLIAAQLTQWGATVNTIKSTDALLAETDAAQDEKDNTSLYHFAILDADVPEVPGVNIDLLVRKLLHKTSSQLILLTHIGDERLDWFEKRLNTVKLIKPVTITELHRSIQRLYEPEGDDTSSELNNPQSLISPSQRKNAHRFDRQNVRVLLVEDNPINQEVALGLLADIGITADTANDGIEALHALENAPTSAPYDLILMDCQLPEMDGYEATEIIRNDRSGRIPNNQITIIAMTANAMKGDKEKCLAVGMNDYLTKPIDPDELERVLGKWLTTSNRTTGLKENAVTILQPKTTSQTPDEIMDDEIWDQAGALKRVRGRHDRLSILISMFCDNMPGRQAELIDALQHGDPKNIRAIAHSIKGMAANLGALKLQTLSAKIEQHADNQSSYAEWQREFPATASATLESFQQFLNEAKKHS